MFNFLANEGFCMGYSLCMMADFQNSLISRIFDAFWSGFVQFPFSFRSLDLFAASFLFRKGTLFFVIRRK